MIELPGPPGQAHVLEYGDGEPAVLLHGGDGEGWNWAALMAQLEDDLHMYAVDRPGFGRSGRFDYRTVALRPHAADFVTSLLDALGIESATLIGGSMGGFFALATALQRPERVRDVILVGYPVGFVSTAPLGLRISCAVPALARKMMRDAATVEGQRAQYRRMFKIDPDTVPSAYLEARAASVRRPGVQETWVTLLRRIAGLRGIRPEADLGDDLPRLRQPTLVVWGENDMAPAERGREAASRIPHCRFEFLPGVGH